MGRNLTEKQVLKKLQIEDFRHITKGKVIDMVSMLDRMDPEVAKKALEQFPDFSKTMSEIFSEYKKTLDEALKTNENSVKSYYESCDEIINCYKELLKNEELTFEQKRDVCNGMVEIVKMKSDKDSENKAFIIKNVRIGATAVSILAITLASILGGNTKISLEGLKA